MTRIDLSPLYRSSIGFDHFNQLFENALHTEKNHNTYPPYNIKVVDDNQYELTLAVAGFAEDELDIQIENGVLRIQGRHQSEDDKETYLHRGIASRSFERKFNLADHVKVTQASLNNGLLSVSLVREIPEAMKPRKIHITQTDENVLTQNAA